MKASHLALWVNEALGLIEEDSYSTRTVITWLHKCGFKLKQDISLSKEWVSSDIYVVFSLGHLLVE